MLKRSMSVLLALVMLLSALPLTAYAAETDAAETGEAYDLWVGNVQVTDQNRNDILGDGGKAKYDFVNKILTLNDPVIQMIDYGGEMKNAAIWSEDSITIKGSCSMENAIAEVGVYSEKNLCLDGDFTFKGDADGVRARLDIEALSGSLNAGGSRYGAYSEEACLIVSNDITEVDLYGDTAGVVARDIRIENEIRFMDPYGARKVPYQGGYYVTMADVLGEISRSVVIVPYVKCQIWVGSVQVTEKNWTDILGDGGKAKYDINTNTLTLNDPVIDGLHEDAKIYAGQTITLTGSYHMTDKSGEYGVYAANSIDFKGDFTFMGTIRGVCVNHYTNVLSGKLKAVGGLWSNWAMTVGKNVERLEMEGDSYAYHGNEITIDESLYISEPEGGYLSSDRCYILSNDGYDAPRAVIEPWTSYGVWVGNVQVTDANKNDILGDGGKAQYDIATKTLTLNDPVIQMKDTGGISKDAAIWSEDDLTVKGSYSMENAIAEVGAYSEKNLCLDGDFTFKGEVDGVRARLDIEVLSGTLNASGSRYGAHSKEAWLLVRNDITEVNLYGDTAGVVAGGIDIRDDIRFLNPYGAREVPYEGTYYVTMADVLGEIARSVVIVPYVKRQIWVGSVQVTEKNWTDILGDGGKAKFDPDTNTLTLNDPVIDGSHEDAKIYAGQSITIAGRYHMTANSIRYGVYAENSIDFKGDFTFMGIAQGVCVNRYTKVLSGKLKAIGGNCGVFSYWEMTVDKDVERLEMEGGDYAYRGNEITIDESLQITEPEGGRLSDDCKSILNADGSAAEHVVIEHVDYYNIWLGSTQVNSLNKDDILGDGGKAVFDPETNTLTLNDPVISGTHDSTKITTSGSVTLKGSYHMTQKETGYGLKANNHITISGDFTFMGMYNGVYGGQYTKVTSGKLKAVGDSEGLYSYWEMTVGKGVERLEMEGGDYAYRGNEIKMDESLLIYEPEGGRLSDNRKSILNADGSAAKHAVIGALEYNIWLGSKRVNSANKDDILGDGGKAKFDPDTNTLTLNKPVIDGLHESAKIYTDQTITLTGSYHMTDKSGGYGIYAYNSIDFKGDFTFMGTARGVYVNHYTKVLSGKLKAIGGSYGVYSNWEMTVGKDVIRLEMEGSSAAYAGNEIKIDDRLLLLEPEDGRLSDNRRSILNADGSTAKCAVIGVIEYDVWLGSTRINSSNKDDILGDGGKAKFDPDTNTLTLNDPVIDGSFRNAKIYTGQYINLKGSYHMTDKSDPYGVHAIDSIDFSGDFTFMGTSRGIYVDQSMRVLSGKLKAVGGSYGVISSQGMTVGKDVKRLEMEGNSAAYSGSEIKMDESLQITEPQGGRFSIIDMSILKPDRSIALRVVIEPKPFILGDVDGDEEVGVIDATYIQRYEAGFNIPISEEDILLRGDVDGDEEVTVIDATYIQRFDAGFNIPYPIGKLISKTSNK